MGKKNFAREPLLYIHQPANQMPKAPMQYNYVTPKKSRESLQSDAADPALQKRQVKRGTYYKELNPSEDSESRESLDESVELNQLPVNEDNVDNGDTTKFKDMTIEEKLVYFANTPSYAPKVRCEIKTEEKTYRGLITDFKENEVYMRVGKRSSSTKIPLDIIKNVRMLGF